METFCVSKMYALTLLNEIVLMSPIFNALCEAVTEAKFFFYPRGRPQSRPVVITIFPQSVRPSVPKLQNQATITAGRDCGLTEWIIDDSCLVSLPSPQQRFKGQYSRMHYTFFFSLAKSLTVSSLGKLLFCGWR